MMNLNVDMSTILQLIARHVLTSAGLWLAGHGYLDSSAVQGFVGAGLIFWGVAWSIWQKNGVAFLTTEKARLEKLVTIYGRQTQQQMAAPSQAVKSQPLPPVAGTQGKP